MEGLSLETAGFSNGNNKKPVIAKTMINHLIINGKKRDSADITLPLFLIIFNNQTLTFEVNMNIRLYLSGSLRGFFQEKNRKYQDQQPKSVFPDNVLLLFRRVQDQQDQFYSRDADLG